MTRIGRWAPCTTSRPLIFSSLRLPASANSLLGASMSIPPIVALGPRQVLHHIGIFSRKGERCRDLGAARKEPHWIIKRYGTEVQLDRVRQFRHKPVGDKRQTPGQALRGWSNRVAIHRRTASDLPKSPVDSTSR